SLGAAWNDRPVRQRHGWAVPPSNPTGRNAGCDPACDPIAIVRSHLGHRVAARRNDSHPARQPRERRRVDSFLAGMIRVWKNLLPVLGHVDYQPSARNGFLKRFVQASDMRFAVVGVFAYCVSMMNKPAK